MQLTKLAVGVFAAGLMASAQAATTFSEGFDNVAALAASGWVFTNASTPAGLSWFQGNSGVFESSSGAVDSYAAANFNSSTAIQGVVDNWLISPELSFSAGSTLQFYTQASDAGFSDLLEVRFSSGASSATSDFTTLLGTVGSTAYPVGSWVAVTLTLPEAISGRFAFHYTVPNALDASYIGIDSVTLSAVPEPASLALFAAGLAAIGVARRRASTSPSV